MDDRVARLRTPAECDQFVLNVQSRLPDLALEAYRRKVELQAEARQATTEAEKDVLRAIYAYEQAQTVLLGRKFRASRTWQMVERHGLIGAAERAVDRKVEAVGYRALAKVGMLELTFESVILRHPNAFSEGARNRSKERLPQITEASLTEGDSQNEPSGGTGTTGI